MDKSIIKSIGKNLLFSFVWTIIFCLIAWVITYFTKYNLKDVLFVEGIFIVILGLSVTFKSDSSGLSLMGLGQSNAQYLANANLEVTRKVNDNLKGNAASMFRHSFNGISLIIAGIVCVMINFIIWVSLIVGRKWRCKSFYFLFCINNRLYVIMLYYSSPTW